MDFGEVIRRLLEVIGLISAIGGAEIVGLTSATVALAGIVSGFLSLGEEAGVRRFVGACKGTGDKEGVANYFWSTILFRNATFVPAGLAMIALGSLGLSFGGLDSDMLFYAGGYGFAEPSVSFRRSAGLASGD